MDRQTRHPLRVPVLLPSKLTGTTTDLGERGIGFVSSRRYQVGEQLQIRVMLPSARPLTIRAQVVWCNQTTAHHFRCGARLSAIGLRASLFLRDYLTRTDHRAALSA